jgi:hypothetical protein
MGINGKLKQLSPYLLETLKEDPVFVWLFLDSKYMIDLDYLQYVQDFPANCAYNFRDEISQLQAIEKYRTKEYQKIKTDILIEGENTELDLHKYWKALHFLLTWNVPINLPLQVGSLTGAVAS